MVSLREAKRYRIREILETFRLRLPEFQRPYEWETEHVERLLEDLQEAYESFQRFKGENEDYEYLLGNVIFYEPGNKDHPRDVEIIDGQQRFITIGMLLSRLGENGMELEVRDHPVSRRHVRENLRLIDNFLERFRFAEEKEDFLTFLKNHLSMTVLITDDVEFAFFLFDSHNTRGKPLEPTDLLKVHHLRRVMQETEEKKAEFMARAWEGWERPDPERGPVLRNVLDMLYIIRRSIRGEITAKDLIGPDLFQEFQAEAGPQKLYTYNQPPFFSHYTYDMEKDEIAFQTVPLVYQFPAFTLPEGWRFLPFEIPKSVEGGERFFHFLHKYIRLLEEMKALEIQTEEVSIRFFELFEGTWRSKGNFYLDLLYRSALLLYYDMFGKEGIQTFVVDLIILLTHLRLSKKSLHRETVVRALANDHHDCKNLDWCLNLFKLLFLSYAPEVVSRKLGRFIHYHVPVSELQSQPDSPTVRAWVDGWSALRDRVAQRLKELGKSWEFPHGT